MRLFLAVLALLFLLPDPSLARWTWLSPTPQGNNLYDVTFLTDNTAVAVGGGGTVLVTHDAGLAWASSFKTNGITAALRRIARIDDVTAVAVGDGGVILKTSDGGAGWSIVTSGTTVSLIDVSFAGAVGVAVGGAVYGPNVMIRSVDGGDTWAPVPNAPYPVYGVEMATTLVGYCRMSFMLLKSTDGGLTWALVPNGPNLLGYSHSPLSFADESNGVIAGNGSSIYVTHDGGTTWAGHVLGTGESESGWSATDIEFVSPAVVQASVVHGACDVYTGNCTSDGQFYESTNDGATWAYQWGSRVLNGVAVNASGTTLTVGDGGVIHRWIEPGVWEQVGGATPGGYVLDDPGRLAFRDPYTGLVLFSQTDEPANPLDIEINLDVIMRTATGGISWATAYTGWAFASDVAYAVGSTDVFAVATQGWGAGRYSQLLKSTDNGATWLPVWSAGADLGLTAIEFGSATRGIAVGSSGAAAVIDGNLVSTLGVPSGIQGLAFVDESTVIAVGGGTTRIIRSTDGGDTWSPITSPVNKTLYDAGFVSPTIGVAVGAGGTILRTDDGGLTWMQIQSPTTEFLRAVGFSGLYGMAVGGWEGAVIETTDAGLTWTSRESPAAGPLTDVVVFAPRHALVAGPELTVLEYRENPVPTLFTSLSATPRPFAAQLRWSVGDDRNLERFTIRRIDGAVETAIADGLARGTRSFLDEGLTPGRTYEYRLIAFDRDGAFTPSARVSVTIPTAVVELLPNLPNPFNPATTIRFVVPEKERVVLSVYDAAGRHVATLVDDVRDPGVHSVAWNGSGAASGVYFARLRAGKTEVSRKLVLLK